MIPQKKLPWKEAIRLCLTGRPIKLGKVSFGSRYVTMSAGLIVLSATLVVLATQFDAIMNSWLLPALGIVAICTLIQLHRFAEEVYDYHTYAVLMRHNEKARDLLSSSWNSPSFWDRFFIVTFYGGFVFLLVKNIDDSWAWEQLFWCELGAAALAYAVRLRWRIWLHGRAQALA